MTKTSIAFVIDNTLESPGQFDRVNNVITLKYESDLANTMYILEELVHVVQDEEYYDVMGPFANFEFEAKMITDISVGCGSVGTFNINDADFNDEYINFVESVVCGELNDNTWLNQYNELQRKWYEFQRSNQTNYSKMSLSSTISPEVLIDFVKLYNDEE